MDADIARVSYDPARHYRSLVAQQGRVTLEADNNEGTMLQAEALRLETIDIVGPAGTPDNGYAVSSGSGPGGVTVGPGIFYLGGWRLRLDAAVDLSKQPDWVDAPAFTTTQGDLAVALLVTEQSVCAAEDQALREVALGGPDSAARTRLMQRFLRVATTGTTCSAGASSVAALLTEDGVTVDAYSLQLVSSARLRAGFVPGQTSTDPCQPSAVGGYLGADNQLIRVTVTSYNATAKTGTLLWGWNNASLLYRAEIPNATDPLTLKLTTVPVDQEHAPQQNQIVEILRTTTELGDNNFIADGEGYVIAVAQAWSPDTGEIVLAHSPPTGYQNNTDPLFVRLWQAEVNFEAGKAVALDTTSGITVAITMDALPSNIAARPFWHFAVRPAMPQAIFPQRYQDAPQRPDGPRQWITDLAVVSPQAQGSTLLADCRIPFLPLTQQKGGCCGVVMGPADVSGAGGLQAVCDSLAGSAAILSLRTGSYNLAAPLMLSAKHAGLTIEGCTDKVVLQATGTDLTPFRAGLVKLDGVRDVTLRRLEFEIPLVAQGQAPTVQVGTLVGMTVLSAQGLTIDACVFGSVVTSVYAFGAAILVVGPTAGVTLTKNAFGLATAGPELFGVLAIVVEDRANAELDQWLITGNRFANLLCAVLGFAQLGLIRCKDNVVTGSQAGFFFAEANLGDTTYYTQEALARGSDVTRAAGAGGVTTGQAAYAALRPDILTGWSTKIAPVVNTLPATSTPTISDVARSALVTQMKTAGSALYAKLAPTGATTTAATTTDRAQRQEVNVNTVDFENLGQLSMAGELAGVTLTPALRIEDNEITVVASATSVAGATSVGSATSGASATSAAGANSFSLGIDVILSPSEPGSVIVSGNRVVVPDATTVACGLLFPAGAVVTGNLLAQLQVAPDRDTTLPCLILITNTPAIMVSANLASFTEYIFPPRATSAATTSWEFLETTG
jgi:hypothetical protein